MFSEFGWSLSLQTSGGARFPVTLTQLSCIGWSLLCPPPTGEGPSFAPSQAFPQLDLCFPMQPHPALVSQQDAEVAQRRQNPGGAPGSSPLPPQGFANCFSTENSVVLANTWDEPRAEFHPWDVVRGMPTLPDAPHPALPDLQHCKPSARLCLGMGTAFTAGKQHPARPEHRAGNVHLLHPR